MDERRAEADLMPRWTFRAAEVPYLTVAGWTLDFKRWVARPFLAACGAGDCHAALIRNPGKPEARIAAVSSSVCATRQLAAAGPFFGHEPSSRWNLTRPF